MAEVNVIAAVEANSVFTMDLVISGSLSETIPFKNGSPRKIVIANTMLSVLYLCNMSEEVSLDPRRAIAWRLQPKMAPNKWMGRTLPGSDEINISSFKILHRLYKGKWSVIKIRRLIADILPMM